MHGEAIEIAVDRYRNILKDDAVLATFEFSWEHLGVNPDGSGVVAQSEVVESAQSYSAIRNAISAHYAAESDDSDFFENGLYNSFPLGSSIGYARPGNATDSTNAIAIAVGAVVSAGIYIGIVYGVLTAMVRNFDFTVRKLAGTR